MTEPNRPLRALRGGDGPGLPGGRPPEQWPDFDELQPYWDSFVGFALSEIGHSDEDAADIRTEFVQRWDGSWQFRAFSEIGRKPQQIETGQTYTQMLVYDSSEDSIEFRDSRDGSSWVMESAFGDATGASSRL